MNRFWLGGCCGRPQVTSPGASSRDSAGQPARRTAVIRVLFASLSVVIAVASAACSGSPGGGGQGRAATAASPSPVFASKTVPDAPVGRQLTWFLGAVGQLPWPRQVIGAHFGSGVLRQISPAQVNSAVEQGLAAEGASLSSSGASLTGLLWQDPAHHPVALAAVAAFGSVKLTVNISVDSTGRISELLLRPYLSSWAQIDRNLAALAPDTSLLVARVSPSGRCTPVHQVAASTARPLASMFKLFVLGALAHQITAGRVSWHQELTVTGALKSPGSGSLQNVRAGTRVPVRQTAAKMIALSDNTAADMLIHLVGRPAVQAQDRQWSDHAARNVPFLTPREYFRLEGSDYPVLANRYLSLAPARRAAFLATSVDPLPFNPAQVQTSPIDIDTIEWLASPDDICRAFAGLKQLAAQPALAPLGPILSANNGSIGLDPAQWPTIWYKGGSSPGVLTVGYLATNSQGQTFVVTATLSDPAAVLPPSAPGEMLAIAQAAFELATSPPRQRSGP
jgi:beta-lactamase class A